eukprot:m.49065 g.49065  ORF g.49065 m.49065 type:complete len:365 (-) comp12046_c0_seq1:62-1156(-)
MRVVLMFALLSACAGVAHMQEDNFSYLSLVERLNALGDNTPAPEVVITEEVYVRVADIEDDEEVAEQLSAEEKRAAKKAKKAAKKAARQAAKKAARKAERQARKKAEKAAKKAAKKAAQKAEEEAAAAKKEEEEEERNAKIESEENDKKKKKVVSVKLPGGWDLIVNARTLKKDARITKETFEKNDCAVLEKCVRAPGKRSLLRFSTALANIGKKPMRMGNPLRGANSKKLFSWHTCHAHFHMDDFVSYELKSEDGGTTILGRKNSFCVRDDQVYAGSSNVKPPEGFTCLKQGLSPSWEDVYAWNLDCQYIDVTDVPKGWYHLCNTVNMYNRLQGETRTDNNQACVRVFINPNKTGKVKSSVLT